MCCVLCLRANTIVILTTTSSERTKVSFSYLRVVRLEATFLSFQFMCIFCCCLFDRFFVFAWLVSFVSYANFFATGVIIDFLIVNKLLLETCDTLHVSMSQQTFINRGRSSYTCHCKIQNIFHTIGCLVPVFASQSPLTLNSIQYPS